MGQTDKAENRYAGVLVSLSQQPNGTLLISCQVKRPGALWHDRTMVWQRVYHEEPTLADLAAVYARLADELLHRAENYTDGVR